MGNYNLARFLQAGEYVYPSALKEIRSGAKQSHWMWIVFPQLKELGRSETSLYYGINSLEEAKAYIKNPILSYRLEEACNALLGLKEDNILNVFEYPDNLKLCSSMTLFECADPKNPVFKKVLDKYYNGVRDELTLRILNKE